MSLHFIGTSFRELSLEKLEVLEAHAEKILQIISSPEASEFGITGVVLVSTCNRFEIYFDSSMPTHSQDHILAKVIEITGIPTNHMRYKSGAEVTRHLFRVAAGLESMIVGEDEIAGQVKRSLSSSQLRGITSRNIEMLFQESSRISKKVAAETGLGKAGRSLVTGGLELVKQTNFDFEGKRVLVLGTGAYARVVTAALKRERVREILTYSMSGRANLFSASHQTTPIKSGGLSSALSQVDLLVTCNGTHGSIITREHLAVVKRESFPILDLSLAKDVDNSVKSLGNVVLIDLQDIYRNAPVEHHETIARAESIVEQAVLAFGEKQVARLNFRNARVIRGNVVDLIAEEIEFVLETASLPINHG